MSGRLLILEGLTGSGKTTTIEVLRSSVNLNWIPEENTFDDFMAEHKNDPEKAAEKAHARMFEILERLEDSREHTVLERFFFSQVAVGSRWQHYQDLNDWCKRLGCAVAVLHIPRASLASRSMYRAEYENRDWQDLVRRYGNESAALTALENSQSLRLAAIEKSGLRYRAIDTSQMEWSKYAGEIKAWLDW